MDTIESLGPDADSIAMLQESLQRYGQGKYGFDARRAWLTAPHGYGAQAWNDYADMGWLAAAMPVADGGLGSDPTVTVALMRYCGEFLVQEPLFGSGLLCGRILAAAGDAGRGRLESLATGRVFALAHAESAEDGFDGEVATACRSGQLTGRKVFVLHGDAADELIVSAVPEGASGIALYAVDPAQAGVRRTAYRLLDGRWAASIELQDAQASLLVESVAAGPLLDAVLDEARFALSAEAHGAIGALNRATLAYLKDRRQFGTPIGTNQALQHRMVELFMLEHEVGAAIAAAARAWHGDAADRRKAIAAATAHAITAGRLASHEAVQLHGGIGITEELAVSHYFRRIMVINRLLGDRDAALRKFASAVADATSMGPSR